MKKSDNKAILLHSLELSIFLLEVEKLLLQMEIDTQPNDLHLKN